MKEKEIQKALKYMNRMEAGLTYRPDDLTAKEIQYIDIVQSGKNEFQMEEQQKNRR